MIESLNIISHFIEEWVLFGFGLYSLLYLCLKIVGFTNSSLKGFDYTAIQFLIYSGIIFSVLTFIELFLSYLQLVPELDKIAFRQKVFGSIWPLFLGLPLFYLLLTQLYWIKKLRDSPIFRFISAIFFLLAFERISNYIISMNRDYLPSNWSMFSSSTEILLMWILKTLTFILIVLGIHFIKSNLNKTN